jgi:hypothetical protein
MKKDLKLFAWTRSCLTVAVLRVGGGGGEFKGSEPYQVLRLGFDVFETVGFGVWVWWMFLELILGYYFASETKKI